MLSPAQKTFKYLFFLIILGVFVALTQKQTNADDPCKDISDLDDKAKCYEQQIDKKEDQYESTSKKLADIRAQKNSISAQINNYASQLDVTQDQLDEVANQIKKLNLALDEINTNLEDRRQKLSSKITLRNSVVRNYSKRTILNDLELFFYSPGELSGFSYATLSHMFNKSISNASIKLIQALNVEISSFEKDKKEAEDLRSELSAEEKKLVTVKIDLDKKKKEAQSKVSELSGKETGYQNQLEDLQEAIDDLNEKQQSVLNEKNGEGNNSVGNYTPPSSRTPDPPFSPAFGAFSYGAYTHYNGMSQYGAKGRAEDDQDYKEILKFYYKVDVIEEDDFPDEINVKGHGELDFQYYLYGIAEMPSNWPSDALKAQAIAARTYAYRASKPICTTEACQVFSKSKADNPPSAWKEAVDDTEDKILDDPKTSQYSSTTGGYINNVGWDDDGDWPGDAYEKKGGSPWFYKAWYTKGYSGTDSCGHPHPWLTEKEMADILNAWVVWRKGNSGERGHISPVTTSCWGGDPYSLNDMADKAEDYGEKYTSVSSVDVNISTSGYTSKVSLNTNRGSITIDGDVFKTVFNLRAPGYISIKSRLFDLEKK